MYKLKEEGVRQDFDLDMEAQPPPECYLAHLPVELQWKCLSFLGPSAIANFGATCQNFRGLVQSIEVCKPYIRTLWHDHHDGDSDEGIFDDQGKEDWHRAWSFLAAHERYLG